MLLVLPILLSVAGHSAPPPAARPPARDKIVTACLAVTRDDVSEALGREVETGEDHTDKAQSTCDYSAANGQVSVTLQHSAAKLDIDAEIASLQAALPDARIREVTGLGTRAFFLDIEGAGTQLHIIRGEHDALMVSVLGFGEPQEASPVARKIARKALDRL